MCFAVVVMFWHTTDTFVSYACIFFYEQQKIGIKASDVKVRSKTQFGRSISFFFQNKATTHDSLTRSISHLYNKWCDFLPVLLLYAEITGASKGILVRLTKFALLHTNRSEISLDLAEIWRRITFVKITGEGGLTQRKQRKAQSVTAALTCTHMYCGRH